MKYIICVILLCLGFSGCASSKSMKFYILGVDVNEAVKAEDVGEMLIGAAASAATHIAGHYMAAELVDGDIDQQGMHEVVTNYDALSQSDRIMIGRGGFLLQAIANTTLTSFESTRKSSFTRGYTLATMAQSGLYIISSPPSSNDGDLWMIDDNGGNANLEWGLYTGTSIYNFYRINKEDPDPSESLVYGIRKDVKSIKPPIHTTGHTIIKSANCWGIGFGSRVISNCSETKLTKR